MLLDYYYLIKNQQTEGQITWFDVILLPECNMYEGHFPGMPVAPGVCNIQMIKECVEHMTGKKLRLEYISRCKFSALISPQQHRELQIRIMPPPAPPKGGRIEVVATLSWDGKELMVFKGEYGEIQDSKIQQFNNSTIPSGI